MKGILTLKGSHLVNRLSETGGLHESRLFSSDPEWVELVDALYGSTLLGSVSYTHLTLPTKVKV